MIFLTAAAGTKEKLIILSGLVLFSCLLYLVLPKMARNKVKRYYEQCELEQEGSEDGTVEK